MKRSYTKVTVLHACGHTTRYLVESLSEAEVLARGTCSKCTADTNVLLYGID